MSTAAQYRTLRPEIQRILLQEWDPIGIADHPGAQDEYDSYIAGVFGLLSRTADPTEIARYLISIEVDRMGADQVGIPDRLLVAARLAGLAVNAGLRPGPYPCPACGFLVFAAPPGSYDICPVCDWEDDELQLRHPALRGGANTVSLAEAQRTALARFPLVLDLVRGFRRDPDWRPLADAEWTAALGTLSPGGHLPAVGRAFNEELYYWLHAPNAG